MKIRRFTAAAAMVAAGSLFLAACGDGGSAPADPDAGDSDDSGIDDGDDTEDGDDSGISQDQALSIGWNQPFFEYNSDTTTGNAVANSIVLYMIQSGFNYYDADLNLVQDPSFGTYEVASEDPLQIKYTFADTAEWSDGVPVDVADLILFWGAKNPRFNTVEDDEDEDAAEAGVFFNATNASVALIKDFPEVSDDHKSVTFTYTQSFADWETLMDVGVPAHVVGMHALNISDPMEAKQAVMDAFENDDKDALGAISTFWNEGFQFGSTLPSDESLYLSSGPYKMVELREDQYLTLEKNPDYKGDKNVSINNITIQYSESPEALVQALANGEVDSISPQATADILQSLEQLGDGYTVLTGVEGTYEHVDLVFDNGGPFTAAAYGGDEEAALKVRQAFLKLIPRQEIVDKLIKPLNPEAEIRNSFTAVPGSPMYAGITAGNGMDAYDELDVEGAKALIAEVGVDTPIDVRLMFGAGNERRANEYALMNEVMTDSGLFNLIDSSHADWGSMLSDTALYDASLFAWASSSTAVTAHERNFGTGGQNNFGAYSNAEVDGWFDGVQSDPDDAVQEDLLTKIEAQLVDDAFGLTLWQFPAVTAYNNKLQNVEPISLVPTIFHAFWNWELAG